MAKKSINQVFAKSGKNGIAPVSEITKGTKNRNEISSTLKPAGRAPFIRSYHAVPFNNMNEILPIFNGIDNDLAQENMENDLDMTAADLQDFRRQNQ